MTWQDFNLNVDACHSRNMVCDSCACLIYTHRDLAFLGAILLVDNVYLLLYS